MTAAYVYRIFDGDTDELLYIGSSNNPRVRFFAHRKRDWWPANPRFEQEEHSDREAAYEAERVAIAEEAPAHNVVGAPMAAQIERYVTKMLAEAPPLRPDQLSALAELLRPARERDGVAS